MSPPIVSQTATAESLPIVAAPAMTPPRTRNVPVELVKRASSLLGVLLRARRFGQAPRTPAEKAAMLQQMSARLARAHRIALDVHGPLPTQPCILAANHLGYLDPVSIASVVPCAPLAKREVESWPLLGKALAGAGLFWVQREDPNSGAAAMLRMRHLLRQGTSVLVFPEGTTSDGSGLLPFKRGIFGLSLRTGFPIVPVGMTFEDPDMCWLDDETFGGHYLRSCTKSRLGTRMVFGEPMHGRNGETAEAFSDRVKARLTELRSHN
jgi:1-acyl-sn-glycerol-3-phosphate acyltransferase